MSSRYVVSLTVTRHSGRGGPGRGTTMTTAISAPATTLSATTAPPARCAVLRPVVGIARSYRRDIRSEDQARDDVHHDREDHCAEQVREQRLLKNRAPDSLTLDVGI